MTKKFTLGLCIAVGIALVGSLSFATSANAQLRTLPGSSGSATGSQSGTVLIISRDLSLGATGADVANLQAYLVQKGFLVIPVGNIPGHFGPLTRLAVIKFQGIHGLPNTGYFGPLSRAALAAELAGGNGNDNNSNPNGATCRSGYTLSRKSDGTLTCVLNDDLDEFNDNNDNNDDNDNNDTGDLEGDEASLDNLEVDEGEDTDLEEGDTDAEVVTAEFDVEDGDIKLQRADFIFEFTGDNDSADDRPWEVFDHAALIAEGDEIAEMDVDNEDDWDEQDDGVYRLRFSSLDEYIVRDGDTAELALELDVNDEVEGSDSGDARWDISIDDDGIRAIDAEGLNQEIGDADETIGISIDNGNGDDNDDDDNDDDNGNDEGLTIDDSDESPDEDEIAVLENDTSSWKKVFAFEIEADNNDISIHELPITLEFLDDGEFDDYVDEIKIEIDGDSFDEFDEDTDDNTSIVTFDLSDDVNIDEDDVVTVEVFIKFKEQDGNYDDGAEIRASITSDNVDDIDAEGDDNLDEDQLDGEAEGEKQTLVVD